MLRHSYASSAPGASRSRLLAVALALAAAWWMFDMMVVRSGPPHLLNDVWEDALVARSLLAGHGFRSTMLYPPLWAMHDPRTLTVPVLVHGPLMPLLLAPLLAIFGPGFTDHVAWIGVLAAWLTAFFVGRLATRIASPGAGATAVAFLTLTPVVVEAVHHSQSVMLGAMAVAVALDALVRERPRPLRAGFALGLGYLIRPEMLIIAPLLALGAKLPWRAAARCAGAFIVCALPWWVHHALALGAPLFNLTSYTLIAYTPAHPGHSPMQDFALTPQRWPAVLATQWPTVLTKVPVYLRLSVRIIAKIPTLTTSWLMAVGMLAWLTQAHRRRLVMAAVVAGLVPVAMMTFTLPQPLYLVPLLAVYVLAAAIGADVLAGLPPWRGRIPAWPLLPVLLMLLSALPAARTAHQEGARVRHLLDTDRALVLSAQAHAPAPAPGAPPVLMFSDRPDFLAWTTGRPVLWMTGEQYDALYPRSGALVPRPAGLPAKRDTTLTWFHDDFWATGHSAQP